MCHVKKNYKAFVRSKDNSSVSTNCQHDLFTNNSKKAAIEKTI